MSLLPPISILFRSVLGPFGFIIIGYAVVIIAQRPCWDYPGQGVLFLPLWDLYRSYHMSFDGFNELYMLDYLIACFNGGVDSGLADYFMQYDYHQSVRAFRVHQLVLNLLGVDIADYWLNHHFVPTRLSSFPGLIEPASMASFRSFIYDIPSTFWLPRCFDGILFLPVSSFSDLVLGSLPITISTSVIAPVLVHLLPAASISVPVPALITLPVSVSTYPTSPAPVSTKPLYVEPVNARDNGLVITDVITGATIVFNNVANASSTLNISKSILSKCRRNGKILTVNNRQFWVTYALPGQISSVLPLFLIKPSVL